MLNEDLLPGPILPDLLKSTPVSPATMPDLLPGPVLPDLLGANRVPSMQNVGDLLFPPKPPSPPVSTTPERSLMGDMASALTRGIALRVPEMAGHVAKFAVRRVSETPEENPLFKAGEALTTWAEEAPKKHPFLAPSPAEQEGGVGGFLRRGVTGTLENAPASLTPALTGAAVGSIFGPPGTVVGGLVGAGLATLATFGASQFNQSYEDAIKAGKSESEAKTIGLKMGLIEGGIESLTTPVELMTAGFGKLGSQPLKQTIRQFLHTPMRQLGKDILKTIPLETGTEMLQSGWEAKIEQEAGYGQVSPGEAVAESILPSIGMSILFGVGAHGLNRLQRKRVFESLTDENQDPNDRAKAAALIQAELEKKDPDLAKDWGDFAINSITNRQTIPIDADFETMVPRKGKPPGGPAPGAPPPAGPMPQGPTPEGPAPEPPTPPQTPGAPFEQWKETKDNISVQIEPSGDMWDRKAFGDRQFITRPTDVPGVRQVIGKIRGKETIQALWFDKQYWTNLDVAKGFWTRNAPLYGKQPAAPIPPAQGGAQPPAPPVAPAPEKPEGPGLFPTPPAPQEMPTPSPGNPPPGAPPLEGAGGPPKVGAIPNEEPTTEGGRLADLTKFPVRRVPTSTIKTDVPNLQFKLDVNAEGVQKPLKGEYNELAAGNLLLWESKDGELFVANGHHRLAHAKATGRETVNAQVLREQDGYTISDARKVAAETNILEGKGTIYDQAEYFRLNPEYTPELSKRKGLAGEGYAIGRFAADNTYAQFRNRRISPEATAAISTAAPNEETLQNAGVKFALENPKADALEVENFVRALTVAPQGEQMQPGLFNLNDAAIQQAGVFAKIVAGKIRQIREQINAVRGAVKRPEIAAQLGVNVNDPQAVQAKITQLNLDLARWQKWYLHPDLVNQVRGEAELPLFKTQKPPTEGTKTPPPGEAPAEPAPGTAPPAPVSPTPKEIAPPEGSGRAPEETPEPKAEPIIEPAPETRPEPPQKTEIETPKEKPPWEMTAKDLVEARTREEIYEKLTRIFGTEEDLARFDDGRPFPDKETRKRWALAQRYMAGLERAAVDREEDTVERILQRVQRLLKPDEYPGGKSTPIVRKERRKDPERRKRISEMSPEEMRRELLIDPLTGLGNRRAYDESERMPFQAMIDVDSLKAVNDIMGHEAGDELLKAVGQALGKHAARAFHASGDEFIVEGNTWEEVADQVEKARELLNKATIEATAPDGTKYTYKGLGVSYGIGRTLEEADQALAGNKQRREEDGVRAPRGERPKELAGVPAERKQDQGPSPRGINRPEGWENEAPNVRAAFVIAERIASNIDKEIPIKAQDLLAIMQEEWGSTVAQGGYSMRDAYDALEIGVNRWLMDNPDRIKQPDLEKLMNILPTETRRTEDMVNFQQYSTPPNFAYIVNWLANIQKNDVAMDTSAGNGCLISMAKAMGARAVVANEIDSGRAQNLRELPGVAMVYNEDAEQASRILLPKIGENRPTVMVLNPPFSTAANRLPGKKDAQAVTRHIEQALSLLPEGGRLVAITGRGMTMDAPTFRDWWERIQKQYNVLANVGVDGYDYRKYGSSFDTRIFVIDKTGPTTGEVFQRAFKSVWHLREAPQLQEVRNARRIPAGEQPRTESNVQGGAPQGETGAGGNRPVLAPISGLGPGVGGAQNQQPGHGGLPRPATPPEAEGGHGLPHEGEPGGRGGRRSPGGRTEGLEPGEPGGENTGPPGQPNVGGTGGLPGPAPGLTPQGYGAKNKLVTNDRAEEIRQKLRAKLNQVNVGIDPEMMALGAELAVYHIEAGARSFVDFTQRMINDLGEKIRPYLRAFYASARNWPGLDNAGMNTDPQIDEILKEKPPHPPQSPQLADKEPAPEPSKSLSSAEQAPREETPAPATLPGETKIGTVRPDVKDLGDSIFDDMAQEKITVNGVQVKDHPGKLVESAAQAAVKSPDVSRVKLNLRAENLKYVSNPQIKMAMLAVAAHDRGKAFFNGGGTGFGKGLTNAILAMHYLNSGRKSQRKVVWISEKKALIKDAKRDFKMAGGNENFVVDMSRVKTTQSIAAFLKNRKRNSDEGLLFLSYDTLKSEPKKSEKGQKPRIDQIVEWLGDNFDGLIIMDESHNMGNAVSSSGRFGSKSASAKALAGIAFQDRMKDAKIVYASATGATEVVNLAYAKRLGLWGPGTPFANVETFVGNISRGGISEMELIARDLKAMGLYMAPSLDYKDVAYDRLNHALSPEQKTDYNALARAWQIVLRNINDALQITGGASNSKARARAMSVFWAAHQRFFNQIITSMQMPAVLTSMREEMGKGKSIVIQLVNTLEASQERQLAKMKEEEELEELDLTPRDQLVGYLEAAFPIQVYEEYQDEEGNVKSRPVKDKEGNPVVDPEAVRMRDALIKSIENLKVPNGPINILLDEFGAQSVAEITGRKRRIVRNEEGKAVEEKRSPMMVETEADEFKDGKRRILIFSDYGGTGRSYHADLDARNQQKRIHYVVQAGWRADKAIQGMGRTHRTNQAVAPGYYLVQTDLSGQKRFISSIARRLDQLGALTKGQRQTGSQGLFSAQDNLENMQASEALVNFYAAVYNGSIPGLTTQEFESQTGLKITDKDGRLKHTDLPPMTQFLNRILSMEIDLQNATFEGFERIHQGVIEEAMRQGRLDLGMQNLHAERVTKVADQVVHTDPESKAETRLTVIDAEHRSQIFTYQGLSGWAERMVYNEKSGMYWAVGRRINRTLADGTIEVVYPLRSANYTAQYLTDKEIKGKNWTEVPKEMWPQSWTRAVDTAPKTFTRRMHLITGAVLPIWDRLSGNGGVIRFQTVEGERMIGRIIPESQVKQTLENLGADDSKLRMGGAEAYEKILADHSIRLANGWKIFRNRSYGEERIEIIGPSANNMAEFRPLGIFSEMVDFRARFFIPNDRALAPRIIEQITKNRPIVKAIPKNEIAENPASFVMGKVIRNPEVYDISEQETPMGNEVAVPEILNEVARQAIAMLPEGSRIKFVDRIDLANLSEAELQGALKNWFKEGALDHIYQGDYEFTGLHRKLNFSGRQVASIIDVATTFSGVRRPLESIERTVWHEAWHGIQANFLNGEERMYLKQRFPSAKGKDTLEIQADAFAEYARGIRQATGLLKKIFERIKTFLENLGNYLHGKGYTSAREIFGRGLSGELKAKRTLRSRPAMGSGTWFDIEERSQVISIPLQDRIEDLTSPDMVQRAASDKNFLKWLKDKAAYLDIKNKDMSLAEQYLYLPYYQGKKFPEMKMLIDAQQDREERRSQGVQEYFDMANVFFRLNGKQLEAVERALISGDRDKAVYGDGTLREDFGLDETGIEAYRSVRTTLDSLLQRWLDHSERALLRPYEESLTPDEYQQLTSVYKENLTPDQIAALPQPVYRAYVRLSPRANLIKRIRSQISEFKGYFPRYRRPGKYYITVQHTYRDQNQKEKKENVFTAFAGNKWEAKKIVDNLRSNPEFRGMKILYGRHVKEADSTFFGLSDINMQRMIDNAIGQIKQDRKVDENTAESLRFALAQSVAESLLARGAGERVIKRSKNLISGYETAGLQQILKNYIVGYMGMETKHDAAFRFLEILKEVDRGKPVLFQETSHYAENMLRNYDRMDRWFSKMRGLAFTYFLSGSIRAAVVQFTQNFVTGIPFLAREMKGMGILGAERAYTRAMWDTATGNITQEERMMIHELLMRGIANDQFIRQISREVRGSMDEMTGKVFDIMALPFSRMETFNRKSAALAAFRVYKEKGEGFQDALDKARDFIYDTHYLMTKANIPHAARGGDIPSQAIGTAYTFRRFTHNYILSMIYSFRDADGNFNLKKMDVFLRSLAWMAVFGGLAGLPFLDDLLDQLEKFFGIPFRTKIRELTKSIGGEVLERASIAGIPALLGQIPGMVGVDLSGSIRIGLPNITAPLKGGEETVFGVWGGLGRKMANAWEAASREDYLRAVEFASPAFLENMLKAARMASQGATTPAGKVLFDEKGRPIRETTGEAIAQAAGFRPERIAAASKTHREYTNLQANYSERRNDLFAKARLAAGKPEAFRKIIFDVQKYNLDAAKYGGAVPLINSNILRRAMTAKPEGKFMVLENVFGQEANP